MAELADALDLGSDLDYCAPKCTRAQKAARCSIYKGFGGCTLGVVRQARAPNGKTKCHHMCHRNALDFYART
jgi:hypothetical protein